MANAFLADCKYGTKSSETQPLKYLSAVGSPVTQIWLLTAVKKGLLETWARKLPL